MKRLTLQILGPVSGPLRTLVALACVAAACASLVPAPAAADAPEPPGEYDLKAAFLFNFAKFVEWPPGHRSERPGEFVFGVVGDDPFGESIDRIQDRTLNGRRVVVKRANSIEDLDTCEIVFIPASEITRIGAILEHLGTRPVLTVGEVNGFVEMGGIINFVTGTGNTVRFEINPERAEAAGLRLSSKLLRLSVRAGRPAENDE